MKRSKFSEEQIVSAIRQPDAGTSLAEAQTIIEAWPLDYNQRRSHGSLGLLTSNEFVSQRQVTWAAEDVVCPT